jgi:hypothetical protein
MQTDAADLIATIEQMYAGAEPMPLAWLETVLPRRRAGRWRVAFLHSTRTSAAQNP